MSKVLMKHLAILTALLVSLNLSAEIHREATVCNKTGEMCFHWWPILPVIEGWQQDKENSYHTSSNVQTPTGFNFKNAETIIYAKAIFKPRQPESKNLAQFIENDKQGFLQNKPGLTIKEAPSLISSNNLRFGSYSFSPKTTGNWERVSYSEEVDGNGNEYYLVFVISSLSESGYKNTMSTYEKFITNYK